MGTESLAAALEREHHEIDEGTAAFAASPRNPQPLARAIRALRRHIYLEEEFLFPLLGEAEPALRAPVFVMLREHAQIWNTLDALEREPRGDLRQQQSVLRHHVELSQRHRHARRRRHPRLRTTARNFLTSCRHCPAAPALVQNDDKGRASSEVPQPRGPRGR